MYVCMYAVNMGRESKINRSDLRGTELFELFELVPGAVRQRRCQCGATELGMFGNGNSDC